MLDFFLFFHFVPTLKGPGFNVERKRDINREGMTDLDLFVSVTQCAILSCFVDFLVCGRCSPRKARAFEKNNPSFFFAFFFMVVLSVEGFLFPINLRPFDG